MAGSGSGGLNYAIVPGNADESITHYRMNSNEPDVRMPEIGRTLIHDEGADGAAYCLFEELTLDELLADPEALDEEEPPEPGHPLEWEEEDDDDGDDDGDDGGDDA